MNRTVIALVDDLFWRTKIEHAVSSAQREVTFLSDPAELAAVDPDTVGLVLVDLSLKVDPTPAVAAFKTRQETKATAVVAYYEHVRKDLLKKGEEAGCDAVLPRSTFSGQMGDLVLKYLLPGSVRAEEEESDLPEE
jgi:CheY-like chemotaxis protein